MRGVFVASRKGGDGVQGAPAPSPRCDYRLDIARARLHTHTYGTSARDYAGSRGARRVCLLAYGRRSGDVVPPPPSIRCRIIRDLYAICYTKTPQASACSQTPRFRRALRVSTNVRRRWGGIERTRDVRVAPRAPVSRGPYHNLRVALSARSSAKDGANLCAASQNVAKRRRAL